MEYPVSLSSLKALTDRLNLEIVTHLKDHIEVDIAASRKLSTNIVTSCRSCWFSSSNWRMRYWSAVRGLPMPGWPFCSALYWASQRRIAVGPMLMLSLTFWTLNITSIYVRLGSDYFEFRDDAGMTHESIVEKIKASQN